MLPFICKHIAHNSGTMTRIPSCYYYLMLKVPCECNPSTQSGYGSLRLRGTNVGRLTDLPWWNAHTQVSVVKLTASGTLVYRLERLVKAKKWIRTWLCTLCSIYKCVNVQYGYVGSNLDWCFAFEKLMLISHCATLTCASVSTLDMVKSR